MESSGRILVIKAVDKRGPRLVNGRNLGIVSDPPTIEDHQHDFAIQFGQDLEFKAAKVVKSPQPIHILRALDLLFKCSGTEVSNLSIGTLNMELDRIATNFTILDIFLFIDTEVYNNGDL